MSQKYINIKTLSGLSLTIPMVKTKYNLTAHDNSFSYPIITCIPKAGYIYVNKLTGEFNTHDNVKDITRYPNLELIRTIKMEGILVYNNSDIIFYSFDDLIKNSHIFDKDTQNFIDKYSYAGSISLLRNFTHQVKNISETIDRIHKRKLIINQDTMYSIYSKLPQYKLPILTTDEIDDFISTYCSS